jgi:RimJ/RimL family protein N-acetyltransferase
MKEEKDFKVYLRAFELTDLEKLNALRNDDEAFLHTGGNKYFISMEYDRKWVEDKIFNNQHQIYLAICLTDTKELVGYLGISEIDYRNRKAQWAGINIDKGYSNKGYATEAAKLMLKFIFEELGLNRFYGYWLESNKPSIRMGEKLGFVIEGLVRGFVYKKNQFQNVYLMSILKEEYNMKLNGK